MVEEFHMEKVTPPLAYMPCCGKTLTPTPHPDGYLYKPDHYNHCTASRGTETPE